MVQELASIRSLLIRAWRERWSDIQWGIHIKTVLPRYISGDIYQLSDCLLQQALMGSLPNNLIMSYLDHSLASQIVSYGGVMESVSKYDCFNKLYCVRALLNIMSKMMKSINCRGKAEDCLRLSTSLLSGVKWVIKVIAASQEKMAEMTTTPEVSSNIKAAFSILDQIVKSSFLKCLLVVGIKEDMNGWKKFRNNIIQLQIDIGMTGNALENNKQMKSLLIQIENIDRYCQVASVRTHDPSDSAIDHLVYSIVMLEVLHLNNRDYTVITRQLLLLKKLKGFTLCDLYLELIRSCLVGMSLPEYRKYQDSKWVGFTYIKLPVIISAIHKASNETGYSKDLLQAMQRISTMTSLLDVVDYKIRRSSLEYLLKELTPTKASEKSQNGPKVPQPSLNLISEKDAQNILGDRMKESHVLKSLINDTQSVTNTITPDLLLRAHGQIVGVFKALITKDSVETVATLLISQNSRNLLLSAATSTGGLKIYASRFIRLSEQFKKPNAEETPDLANSRAIMFEVSFLLLCYIAQVYGVQVLASESNSFFVVKWIKENISNAAKLKPFNDQPEPSEIAKAEEFLKIINSTDSERYLNSNLAENCSLVSTIMRESLMAAYHGHVTKESIFEILDKMCAHLFSLPVCAAACLCSYIQQQGGEFTGLAKEILHYIQKKMLNKPALETSILDGQTFKDSFKDRSNLMAEIITEMIDNLNLYCDSRDSLSNTNFIEANGIQIPTPFNPLTSISEEVWGDIKANKGLLSHKSLHLSLNLTKLGGFKWFTSHYVKCALDTIFAKELHIYIDVVFSLFHVNIFECTLHYITSTLPEYLCGPNSSDLMYELKTSALSKLTCMLLVECWLDLQNESDVKSSDSGLEAETDWKKVLKNNIYFSDSVSNFNPKIDANNLKISKRTSIYLSAIQSLYGLMTQVTSNGLVTPVTHLIVFILKDIFRTPPATVLRCLIPHQLVVNLIPLLSGDIQLSYEELLTLSSPDIDFLNSPHDSESMSVDSESKTTSLEDRNQVENLVLSQLSPKILNQDAAKLICLSRNIKINRDNRFEYEI